MGKSREGGEASDIAAKHPFPLPLIRFLNYLQLQDILLAKIRKCWVPKMSLSSLMHFILCKKQSVHLVNSIYGSS